MEERLNNLLLCSRTVDKVFAGATHDDLAGYGDLREALVVHGGFGLVGIIEYDGDASFRDTGLSAFVDEILLWWEASSQLRFGNVIGALEMEDGLGDSEHAWWSCW